MTTYKVRLPVDPDADQKECEDLAKWMLVEKMLADGVCRHDMPDVIDLWHGEDPVTLRYVIVVTAEVHS